MLHEIYLQWRRWKYKNVSPPGSAFEASPLYPRMETDDESTSFWSRSARCWSLKMHILLRELSFESSWGSKYLGNETYRSLIWMIRLSMLNHKRCCLSLPQCPTRRPGPGCLAYLFKKVGNHLPDENRSSLLSWTGRVLCSRPWMTPCLSL